MILYKCLVRNNDSIIFAAGNPRYVAIAMNLFRSAPPTHRVLLMKIINILIKELRMGLALVGKASIADVGRTTLRRPAASETISHDLA